MGPAPDKVDASEARGFEFRCTGAGHHPNHTRLEYKSFLAVRRRSKVGVKCVPYILVRIPRVRVESYMDNKARRNLKLNLASMSSPRCRLGFQDRVYPCELHQGHPQNQEHSVRHHFTQAPLLIRPESVTFSIWHGKP